ncbi:MULTISPECIES: tyrosine-type recombinase/integrase [unclassified Haloarcula]|uniref:tyrosine-type recombinase/integrase n=1 Tax=unclassified Haloarcula TaxID=2624677 RepID=UPI00178543B5|nr:MULTISPECIES: tyrosine-type recombinase/integrase [unclassified Haloarcula]
MKNEFIADLGLNEESKDQLDRVFTKIDARFTENTYRNRKVVIKQFTEFSIEDDLRDVGSVEVDDWVSHLLTDDYAPRSVRGKAYALSGVFNELVTRNFVESNPVEDVSVEDLEQTRQDQYHTENNKGQYLSIEEYEKLVKATDNVRDKVMVRLLWQTGCRVSEAADVRISDIDRDNRSITIRNAKSGKYKDTGTRTVYYDRKFSVLLRQYIDEGYREGFVGLSEDKEDHGHLLVSNEKYSLNKEYITKFIAEIAERAGIQDVMYENRAGNEMKRVNAHLLRKSYGVHRTKNGMPIAYLSELMGHADVTVTKENYLHFREDDIEEAERTYAP